MRYLRVAVLVLFTHQSNNPHIPPIVSQNAQAIVYLEAQDEQGGVLNRGSGFIVSPDGYVATVAHLKVDSSKKEAMRGIIGTRNGVAVQLAFIAADEIHDIAFWQLPRTNTMYHSIPLEVGGVSVLDVGVVLGFPLMENLSASKVSIRNISSERGFYKSDGYLQHGNSGGPMLTTSGDAVAIVQGGALPGTEDNDLIPIEFAAALAKKNGIAVTIHSPQSSGGAGCVIPPSPLPPAKPSYDKVFNEHQNEPDLAKLGVQAFANGDYLWAIRFLEEAQTIQSSKVWEQDFPYLAAARLLANKDHRAFECTLQEMLAAMRQPGFLHHSATIGFAISNLSEVRHYVDSDAQKYIDHEVLPAAIKIKQTVL